MSRSDYDYHQYIERRSEELARNKKILMENARTAYNVERHKMEQQKSLIERLTKTILAISLFFW